MERHIQLEGGRNFRDLGGYLTQDSQRVRWRRVFRSGLLSDISATDTQVLLDLDISTVIDLRTDSELNEKGPSPLHSHGVEYRHASFIQTLPSQRTDEEAPTIVERGSLNYLRGLERGGPAIISVLTALVESEPGTSLVFNCTAGKDRTGIVAAILLRVLGVPDETIVVKRAKRSPEQCSMRPRRPCKRCSLGSIRLTGLPRVCSKLWNFTPRSSQNFVNNCSNQKIFPRGLGFRNRSQLMETLYKVSDQVRRDNHE
jgi:hypothetical protein